MRRGGTRHEPTKQLHSSSFLSLSLQSLVFASSPATGQDSQNQRETSYSQEREIVTVLLHNYAHLPRQILTEAEDRVSLIFRKAGVKVTFADCPLNAEDPVLYPGCPEVVDGTQLFLRIFPTTSTKMDRGGESFVAARIANIFWNRVEEQAQRLNVHAPRILAHTVAHELGHLLLGSNSHSPTGIMTARWEAQVLVRICQDGLFFNGQQCELIRREIRRRKGQQMAFQNAWLAPQQ
jgi:hypothetical protein